MPREEGQEPRNPLAGSPTVNNGCIGPSHLCFPDVLFPQVNYNDNLGFRVGHRINSLQNLSQLDADAIVPGHGPILHDKTYLFLLRDLMKSAVDQMNAKLRDSFPAMFQTLDDVKGAVDLTSFRPRFAGNDKDLASGFDDMAVKLIKVVFEEASLR